MNVRKPIITVLGHVDAGKTKLLDSVRGTTVAEKEAGGITQHIGATEVPIEAIEKMSKKLIEKYKFNLNIPGLLFIDTPGHEAFTALRKRGGSIADLAVVVVDIHKGLQEQTLEAIEILKSYKCPFIVAANKVDTLNGWIQGEGSVSEALERQSDNVKEQLDIKIYELVGQLHEKGFTSERFDRVKDFTKEIAIIPLSAKARIGLPELLMFLAAISRKFLEKKLAVNVEGTCKGTVLEVKEEKGLGKTLDVIIYDGKLRAGEEILVGGKSSVIKTKVRALLEPEALGKSGYKNVKEVHAAAGVKISAPGLEDALSGSPVRHYGEEAEKEIREEVKNIRIENDAIGPIVRSNTLGSLEAIVKLLEDRGIKVHKADVGEVHRKDVLEAEPIKEKDKFKGVIFAFHTKVSEAAEKEAEKREVRIFKSDIVYRILEEYEDWVKQEKDKEKMEKLLSVTLPVRLEVMKGFVFRHSEPAVVGVKVLEGKLRKGIKLMKKGKKIGKVLNIQSDGNSLDEATKGMEVAVSIEDAVVGKSFDEEDELLSFIPAKQLEDLEIIREDFSPEEEELFMEIKSIISEKAEV